MGISAAFLLTTSFACPRCETPHRLQLKFNLSVVASSEELIQNRDSRSKAGGSLRSAQTNQVHQI